jgi:hypothetical protein
MNGNWWSVERQTCYCPFLIAPTVFSNSIIVLEGFRADSLGLFYRCFLLVQLYCCWHLFGLWLYLKHFLTMDPRVIRYMFTCVFKLQISSTEKNQTVTVYPLQAPWLIPVFGAVRVTNRIEKWDIYPVQHLVWRHLSRIKQFIW